MKHSKHILNTWLLGVFLHPVIYVIYFTIPPDVITYTFLSSLMMGMIFSFPAFIISALLFRFLVKQDWSLWVKYLMLVSGAASGVFKVAIVFAALTSTSFYLDFILELCVPGIISAAVSPLFMYKKLTSQLNSFVNLNCK